MVVENVEGSVRFQRLDTPQVFEPRFLTVVNTKTNDVSLYYLPQPRSISATHKAGISLDGRIKSIEEIGFSFVFKNEGGNPGEVMIVAKGEGGEAYMVKLVGPGRTPTLRVPRSLGYVENMVALRIFLVDIKLTVENNKQFLRLLTGSGNSTWIEFYVAPPPGISLVESLDSGIEFRVKIERGREIGS